MFTKRKADRSMPIVLRLSAELHSRLLFWAKSEERSVNSQIVRLLQQAVDGRPPLTRTDTARQDTGRV
ncbi:MAG: Arc family DNA-binding protein [Chloroflexi bacterium]|nr:Arc family DNA-binding protein [Chloroflexota bacterium]